MGSCFSKSDPFPTSSCRSASSFSNPKEVRQAPQNIIKAMYDMYNVHTKDFKDLDSGIFHYDYNYADIHKELSHEHRAELRRYKFELTVDDIRGHFWIWGKGSG